jgi:glycerol-3-phosphate dehydrogenase (NAD(P)+)
MMAIPMEAPLLMSKAAVVGAGSWGTALAQHLARTGVEISLWDRCPKVVESINRQRENTQYFPGYTLHENIKASQDLVGTLRDNKLVVFGVPSAAIRAVARSVGKNLLTGAICVITAKGFEKDTLLPLHEVATEELPKDANIAVLSGPSFAAEVIRDLPTAVTIAADDAEVAKRAAAAFHSRNFRVYTSSDVVGVEVGGASKNVIAVGVGVIDGVGIGLNARAALITRGLAEIQRLAVALGADPLTVTGLSGLGDLLLTATGELSRNRRVGLGLGRGKALPEILQELGQVAEGVENAQQINELAQRHGIHMPITREVHALVTGECSVEESVERLLSRDQKDERE